MVAQASRAPGGSGGRHSGGGMPYTRPLHPSVSTPDALTSSSTEPTSTRPRLCPSARSPPAGTS
eukprot:1738511-Alexandrium_andersonii.AAC.1